MSDVSDVANTNKDTSEYQQRNTRVNDQEERQQDTETETREGEEDQSTNLVDVYDENASNASPRRLPQQHQQENDDIAEGDQSFDVCIDFCAFPLIYVCMGTKVIVWMVVET